LINPCARLFLESITPFYYGKSILFFPESNLACFLKELKEKDLKTALNIDVQADDCNECHKHVPIERFPMRFQETGKSNILS